MKTTPSARNLAVTTGNTGLTIPVDAGRSFDGAKLYRLGYTDFIPGVTYMLYDVIPNSGGLRPLVIFPHDEASIESSHYACTFVDRDMEIVPAARYYHPDHFPRNWINPAFLKNAQHLAARKRATRLEAGKE